MTAAGPALHLPDLPEVELGGVPPAPPPTWRQTLPQTLANYLPLMLMALLALGTGWLVKNTPKPELPKPAAPPRQTPDYTMQGFSITRFDSSGRVVLRIAGDLMRHFPATDQLEIEGARIHAIAPDGRTTDASARRALANGDGSEVQLLGGAQVHSTLGDGQSLDVQGEFLHAFLRFERLQSHLPVTVRHGSAETRAAGMAYDHLQRTLQFEGPVRATWWPGRLPAARPAPSAANVSMASAATRTATAAPAASAPAPATAPALTGSAP